MLGRISKFSRVDKNNPCPICGKDHWCRFGIMNDIDGREIPVVICNRVQSEYEFMDNGGGYIHFIDNIPVTVKLQSVQERNTNKMASLERRNLIYQKFLSYFTISDTTMQSFIHSRGFSKELIKYLEYKDYDRSHIFQISQELYDIYGDLTGIPGAYLKEKNNFKYWMFGGMDKSVLLPCRALNKENIFEKGPIQAINYRIPGAEKKKYRYLSSADKQNGTSSGAPVHVSVPMILKKKNIIGITEGIIKADYWANRTGMIVLSVMGVSTWRTAISVVKDIQSLINLEGVIVAFDADKKNNEYVRLYENNLINALKEIRIKTAEAYWNLSLGKGIDDLLKNGHSPKYKIV